MCGSYRRFDNNRRFETYAVGVTQHSPGSAAELSDCRATLGFELIVSSVEPNALQLGGNSPRPK